jgi:hypothetical protein
MCSLQLSQPMSKGETACAASQCAIQGNEATHHALADWIEIDGRRTGHAQRIVTSTRRSVHGVTAFA